MTFSMRPRSCDAVAVFFDQSGSMTRIIRSVPLAVAINLGNRQISKNRIRILSKRGLPLLQMPLTRPRSFVRLDVLFGALLGTS